MSVPFSDTAFLDVFGAYNSALVPAVAVLWLVTAGMAARWWWRGGDGRPLFALLAVHWAWSGIAYHWFFFRSINAAAALFAGLFVLQALLFAWLASTSRGRLGLGPHRSARGVLAGGLVAYALVYPLLGLVLGLHYPRLPLFAVPCPTTLLTAGLLLTSSGVPRSVGLVPAIWAAIGTSAAVVLGIRADLALAVAAVLLAVDMAAPQALGPRAGLADD